MQVGASNVDPIQLGGTDGTRTESAWLSLNLEIGPRLIPYVQYVPVLYGMLGNEQSLDWAARPLDFGTSHVVLCGYGYLVRSILMTFFLSLAFALSPTMYLRPSIWCNYSSFQICRSYCCCLETRIQSADKFASRR